MANIKYCARCGGRPAIFKKAGKYYWTHTCEKVGDGFSVTSDPFVRFSDAVRDWNTRVKMIRGIQELVLKG